MCHKMFNWRLAVILFIGFNCVESRSAVDINTQLNRFESSLGHMKPPPELIGNVLQQIQQHCRKNRTIDEKLLKNVSHCVEQHMNETQLIADIKTAVPKGELDDVFRDTCGKWPKVKSCLSEFFVIIEDCWEKGDKVTKAINEAVKFFCGDENDGSRIALFIAEGGMACLEEQGDGVKTCVENLEEFKGINEELENQQEKENPFDIDLTAINQKIPTDISKDDICVQLESVKTCTRTGLLKCKDPTPENLATSMINAMGRAIDCPLKDDTTIVKSLEPSGADSSRRNKFYGWFMTAAAAVGGLLL